MPAEIPNPRTPPECYRVPLCAGNAYAKPSSPLRLLALQYLSHIDTKLYRIDAEVRTRLAPSQPSQIFAKFPMAWANRY